MLSAIIVEDEILAAERLKVLLADCAVTLLHTFNHAQAALDWLAQHPVDVVFADIGLPEINGLVFVERLRRTACCQPAVIFTTAYEEHALKAFELAATDYLLKPIKLARLQAALARTPQAQKQTDSFSHFKVLSRNRMIEVPWQQARYLLAEEKTVMLVTADGQCYDLPKTLIHWEETLGDRVIRIHRNALVLRHGLDSLVRLSGDEEDEHAHWGAKILDLAEILPVSRRQLSAIRKQLRGGADA